jgi:erythromycin esterase-like protein
MGRMSHMLERRSLDDRSLGNQIREVACPLTAGDLSGYDALLAMIGDARIVLIGEASHGTHEFYRERALLTTRLIRELGFSFVAVEGDWPECYAVNRYVRGAEGTATGALEAFSVYPTWMWGNMDVLHFVQWLRAYNDQLTHGPKVGFYGLDLYSMFASMEAVVRYLDSVDPEAGKLARSRYSCFEPFSGSKDMYAYSTGLGIAESCEDAAIAMLQDLQRKRSLLEPISPDDTYFDALMSAEAARDGERYYRSMYRSDESSWNLRDTHMMDTLDRLLAHFGPTSRAVVWEHNTHIGDFRATSDAGGMVNVGQLTRERHPDQSVAVGFGTYQGGVTASRGWGDRPERMTVPPARADSYDSAFHSTGMERSLLLLRSLTSAGRADGLNDWRGQRAIGVVYHPEHEAGNYVPTRLADRYDAYIHIDRTRAIKPLRVEPQWVPTPLEQTYPTGY